MPAVPERFRVGILTPEFPTHGTVGGLSTYCRELYRGLANAGHEPHVLLRTPEDRNPEFREELSVHWVDAGPLASLLPFPVGRGASMLLGRRIARMVADLRLDVVEASDVGSMAGFVPVPLPNRAALVLRLHTGSRVLEQFATTDRGGVRHRLADRIANYLERRAIAHADGVSSVSRAAADRTFADLEIPARPVTVIPNPAPVATVRASAVAASGAQHVVCVGRLARVKGVDLLLDAWPHVVASIPSAQLTIVGEDTVTAPGGGSMREHLLRRSGELGLERSVHLTGYVPHEDIPALLDDAEICVFPSRWEGMPIAVVEAMARGKCVVVSNAPAMREIVQDDATGVIADPSQAEAFAEAIVGLLRDPGRRARLGAAAREHAVREFALETIVRRTVQLYREAWTSRNAR